ncbi:TolC family protein [Candidatus Dependentiae bacterium]|nr:TolC family protein [Candidatus Dependentiae bacterium]
MILLALIFLINALQAEPLTMATAVELALKHSPDLSALRYAIQADQSAAKAAKSGYMPTIDASSNLSRQEGLKTISTQTILSANQLIYAGAGPRQQYQKAKATAECTALEKEIAAHNIRKETEKAFLQAWLIQKQASLLRAMATSNNLLFATHQHHYKLQKIDREIWLQNAADYADQVAETTGYDEEKQNAYNALSFLMGESVELHHANKPLFWQYKQKIQPLKPLDTYINAALAGRPEIPKRLKRIAVEKWNTKILQGTRLPVISVSAQSECNTQPSNTPFTFVNNGLPEIVSNSNRNSIISTWSINLGLKWSLFDGLVTHYQEQQAQANKMKEMLAHEQQLLAIKREVHAAYFAYAKAHRLFKAQRIHLLHAVNNFKLQKQKVTLGKSTPIDGALAKTAWHKARFTWLHKRVAMAQAERDLLHACGYPQII